MQQRTEEELIREIDAEHARLAASHRRLLQLIAYVDRRKSWRDVGARDTAHWLSIRYGLSQWKARRWIAAAHALETLPRTSEALASGELHVDKAVELTRFATPETESRLLVWAGGVSCGAIRRRADVVARRESGEAEEAERSRFLSWWTFDEGRRFGLRPSCPPHRARSSRRCSTGSRTACRSCRESAGRPVPVPGGPMPSSPCVRPGTTPIVTPTPTTS